jgi:hypothetical protein
VGKPANPNLTGGIFTQPENRLGIQDEMAAISVVRLQGGNPDKELGDVLLRAGKELFD